uniref:Transmembrane protein 186 n=1 Tax=Lutzomyia longipalpis TaxID=7200 RepID=A0A7G3ALZ7_LUTLO
MAVAGIGVSGFAALCIFSLLLRNVVGFVYLDSTGERIKLAYVSFLGARLEAEHLVKDVIPADELPPSRYKLYYPLSLRTSKEKYAIFHKGGSMEDIEKFGAIFGYDLV